MQIIRGTIAGLGLAGMTLIIWYAATIVVIDILDTIKRLCASHPPEGTEL